MIERISNPSATKKIIEDNSFYFKKNFGQNFLIDSNVLQNIVSAAKLTKDDYVLEIGPGIGSLTQFLAENTKHVTSVEIDTNLLPILKETLKDYDNIAIVNKDILKADIKEIMGDKPFKIVANLPYYITTPVIMYFLENNINFTSITVMVQKEVADRIKATPGIKDYGALTVATQFYADVELNFIVPPNCFIPRPKVDSSVITLTAKKETPLKEDLKEFFFHVVKSAFSQRRKTLVNTLYNTGDFGLEKADIESAIKEIGLSEKIRGEALSIENFRKLSIKLLDMIEKTALL